MRTLKRIVRDLLKGPEPAPPGHPYEGIPLILATGVGRSGTTVLRQALRRHPDIDYNGKENNVIFDLLGAALRNCTVPSRKVAMVVDQETYDSMFRRLLLGLLWPRPRGAKRRPKMLMALSDLTPERADYLRRLFPGARVVHIVRNGIAVVASRIVYHGFKDNPFEWQCEVWSATLAMAEWGERHEGYFQIRQEQLLDSAEAEQAFRRLFDRLGLPFHQGCLDVVFERRFNPTSFPNERDVDQDDLNKRRERWRFWTDEQKATFARICGPAMDYFGYPIPWLESEEQAPD